MAQVVKHPPCKDKPLSSNLNTARKEFKNLKLIKCETTYQWNYLKPI
jgi:hypothetical protein